MDVISLWQSWCVTEAQLVLIVTFSGSHVSHVPLDNIPQMSCMWVGGPIEHSKDNASKPLGDSFDRVETCQTLLEKEIDISKATVNRRKHEVIQNFTLDSVPPHFLKKCRIYFNVKEEFGPLNKSPVHVFFLAQVRVFWGLWSKSGLVLRRQQLQNL